MMKALELLKTKCNLLVKSETTHGLAMLGPHGVGKSTAINQAFKDLGIEFREIGAFSTPLSLYNQLAETPDRIFVGDDSLGIFEERKTLAILKAAICPTAGGSRIVRYGSTSKVVETPFFEFSGKLVICTNHIPDSADVAALVSRMFTVTITLSRDERYALIEQQRDTTYKDDPVGQKVCDLLLKHFDEIQDDAIQYRMIERCREIAAKMPKGWEDLVLSELPKVAGVASDNLTAVVRELAAEPSVKKQVAMFKKRTGYAESTFFRIRQSLGLGTGIRSMKTGHA
jgi:hypothetical protein